MALTLKLSVPPPRDALSAELSHLHLFMVPFLCCYQGSDHDCDYPGKLIQKSEAESIAYLPVSVCGVLMRVN